MNGTMPRYFRSGEDKIIGLSLESACPSSAAIKFNVTTPGFKNFYSNHYKWNNDFDKIKETRLESILEIPGIDLQVFAGYS